MKLDQGNRCVIWSDSHSGAVLKVEKQFLHNTKITRSARNEISSFKKSRGRKHPVGRAVAFTEMQTLLLVRSVHFIICFPAPFYASNSTHPTHVLFYHWLSIFTQGYYDVVTNLDFVQVPTKPIELRNTSAIKLNRRGKLIQPTNDVTSAAGDMSTLRRLKKAQPMTKHQLLTMKGTVSKSANYDNVTLFSIRPVEMMQLFCNLGEYYRWFTHGKDSLSVAKIMEGLDENVTKCEWIDGVGRRIRLRKKALPFVKKRLQGIQRCDVSLESWELRKHLIHVIENDLDCPLFIAEDDNKPLPIPVFSNVSPDNSSQFILHVMLMLGNVQTELELKTMKSMKHCLAATGLIPDQDLDDRKHLERYSNILLRRIITEVFSVQPITMRKMERYIIKTKRLLNSLLLDEAIPITDLPPCLLTELLNTKTKELESQWSTLMSSQLDVMYSCLPNSAALPAKKEVLNSTKNNPIEWDPMAAIPKSLNQSELSYKEQQAAIRMGVNAVNKYSIQFGNTSQTKGCLTHGNPGSGKSFVLLTQGFYAMTQGLRVLSTALMAKRSNALGGLHLHRLFQLEVNKSGNPRRMAEVSPNCKLHSSVCICSYCLLLYHVFLKLAIQKLQRKSNMHLLHLLMTLDVLLLDECGQLSAQQLAQLDIILRDVRQTNVPFGGVLIFGTFDHCQLGAIDGLPFLLSSHIMTDFCLLKMKHSVRAYCDVPLQVSA